MNKYYIAYIAVLKTLQHPQIISLGTENRHDEIMLAKTVVADMFQIPVVFLDDYIKPPVDGEDYTAYDDEETYDMNTGE